jgi:hypothetical protein
MSVKISMRQLQERLPDLLDRLSRTREEFVVERNGKDCAVIVSPRHWRQLVAGRRLDALGPAYRLSRAKQARVEHLLAAKQQRSLTTQERRELKALLRECDSVLLERANALDILL